MLDFWELRHHSAMDVGEIRRVKLLLLTTRHGREEVAMRARTDPNYLSQIQGEKRIRSMGAKLARRIEKAFKLPHGWMDSPWEDFGSVDEGALALARKIQQLPSNQRAAIQAFVDPVDESSTK